MTIKNTSIRKMSRKAVGIGLHCEVRLVVEKGMHLDKCGSVCSLTTQFPGGGPSAYLQVLLFPASSCIICLYMCVRVCVKPVVKLI